MSQNYDSQDSFYQPEMPMKWHKFLIYFALWAGAVINILNAYRLFTGFQYSQNGVSPEYIYTVFPSLKGIDIVFAVIYVALAVFSIYTRFQLAGFKAGAPGKLIAMYILGLISSLLYLVLVAGACKLSISQVMDSSSLGSIIGTIIMVVANRTYYNKRAHLFR